MDTLNSDNSDSFDGKTEIYIRCANTSQNQLFADHLTQCTGYPATCGAQFTIPKDNKESESLCILLLIDCYKLGEARIWPAIGGPGSQNGNDRTAIAFFNVNKDFSRKFETTAMDRGIRGVFYEGDSMDIIIKGIDAICKGEVWYSRKAVGEYIELQSSKHLDQPNESAPLTHREKEILKLLIAGKSNTEIAEKLCVSVSTVKSHLYNLFKKIEVHNRLQAVFWAAKHSPYIWEP